MCFQVFHWWFQSWHRRSSLFQVHKFNRGVGPWSKRFLSSAGGHNSRIKRSASWTFRGPKNFLLRCLCSNLLPSCELWCNQEVRRHRAWVRVLLCKCFLSGLRLLLMLSLDRSLFPWLKLLSLFRQNFRATFAAEFGCGSARLEWRWRQSAGNIP